MSMTSASERNIHTRAPAIPVPRGAMSFVSISQSPAPSHHVETSSVGHIKGLIKLKKLKITNQAMRHDAGKFPVRECQTRGGMHTRTDRKAVVGKAIAAVDL